MMLKFHCHNISFECAVKHFHFPGEVQNGPTGHGKWTSCWFCCSASRDHCQWRILHLGTVTVDHHKHPQWFFSFLGVPQPAQCKQLLDHNTLNFMGNALLQHQKEFQNIQRALQVKDFAPWTCSNGPWQESAMIFLFCECATAKTVKGTSGPEHTGFEVWHFVLSSTGHCHSRSELQCVVVWITS